MCNEHLLSSTFFFARRGSFISVETFFSSFSTCLIQFFISSLNFVKTSMPNLSRSSSLPRLVFTPTIAYLKRKGHIIMIHECYMIWGCMCICKCTLDITFHFQTPSVGSQGVLIPKGEECKQTEEDCKIRVLAVKKQLYRGVKSVSVCL